MKQRSGHKLLDMAFGAVVLVVLGTGCVSSSTIDWRQPPALASKGKVVYVRPTQYGGVNTMVGKHTFTVFALPVGSIAAHRPVDECTTKAVMDAVTAAGYEARPSSEAPSGVRQLQPTLGRLSYWSYSWFWPLFLEGGGVDLQLSLVDPAGASMWRDSYSARSLWVTPGGAFGFDTAIRGDMTKVVSDIQQKVAARPFEDALLRE